MFNKKPSLRKTKTEKQQVKQIKQVKEDKILKGKEHSSPRIPKSINTYNSTMISPQKHIHFGPNSRTTCKADKCEACSSCSKVTSTLPCSQKEPLTGVSIKDVGLDIAGFLIEEEIKKNKEKLKMEIIRQIALSRELDKHLERQRKIMNDYICHNTLEEDINESASQHFNDFPDECNCLICQETTTDDLTTSTSTCIDKSCFSEKSLKVNKSCKACPEFQNNFAQSTPITKDVSCQECNDPNIFKQTNDCENVAAGQSKCIIPYSASNVRLCNQECIEGYIEDYSCELNEMPITCPALKCKEASTEMTAQTLNNLETLLKTPLNTIKPQPVEQQTLREDTTELILSNIKSIIRDYMENININCKNCQFEDEKNPKPVTETDTKFENDGAHIDIIMQFSESNKKKKAILEIEPCFGERNCKFNKKKWANKKICDDVDMCTLSSDESNSSHKFSPYPLKDRTFRKSSKPKIVCRSRRRPENYCKQKKCHALKSHKKLNISTSSCKNNSSPQSSNHSIQIYKLKKTSSKTSTECDSDSSSESFEVSSKHCKKCCESKNSKSKKHRKKELKCCRRKSIVCTAYTTNLPDISDFPNKHSKTTEKNNSHEQPTILSYTKIFKPIIKQDHKSSRNRTHKSKLEETSNQDIIKYREPVTESSCSFDSSNLDKTSYREIEIYGKSRTHSRNNSKSKKTSYIYLKTLNPDISEPKKKITSKKEYNKTFCQIRSDISDPNVQIFKQSSKHEQLKSSHLPKNVHTLDKITKLKLKTPVKGTKNVAFESKYITSASSLSDPSFYQSEISPCSEDIESDSSIVPIKSIKTYSRLDSEGGIVIVSPFFETKRIQRIQNWLSYMQKLQGKEHFKETGPELVAIKLPKSSNSYSLLNDDSDQQIKYLLSPKPMVNNESTKNIYANKLKERTFKTKTDNFNDTPLIDVNKTNISEANCHKGATYIKIKKDGTFESQIKRNLFKQTNKNSELDFNKSKSQVLYTETSSSSEFHIIGSSLSESSFDTTSESLLDVNENNHDELIQELICPYKNNFKGKYFDVGETDKIINRAFYIQDIFVKLATTEEEKDYWRDTVLRAMKSIVTKT